MGKKKLEDQEKIADSDLVQHFWESRAKLGEYAGTRDVLAKHIEIEAIAKYLTSGIDVLEVGCGNGITAIELAKKFKISIDAYDYAEEMINQAKILSRQELYLGQVQFHVGDVRNQQNQKKKYDIIFTERVLINLKNFEEQKGVIESIVSLLKPNGAYLMCENSQDGLDGINRLRDKIGLGKITPPWHNVYFRDADLDKLRIPGVQLESVDHYSSTYYFFSRIVNAWQAKYNNQEIDYNAPINQLAILLPKFNIDTAQGRIWVWRKSGD